MDFAFHRLLVLPIAMWTFSLTYPTYAADKHQPAIQIPLPTERHPVLLFKADAVPVIRERIEREPYASWWTWVREYAQEVLNTDLTATSPEQQKSACAKALAFAWTVTDDTMYAEKARMILEMMPTLHSRGDWGDIHTEVETVRDYCHAYDMLASYLMRYPSARVRIRRALYREGHRLYTYSSLKETANNWRIRRCAALGLCALALADYGAEPERSGPRDWQVRAIRGLITAIEHQTVSDGGHAEGPNYLRYSADLYIPYLLALQRATGQNLFFSEPFQSLHDWGIKIRLPNGQRPNFDDAALDSFYGGLFARFSADPGLQQWDWLENESGPFCPGLKRVDAICEFDDSIVPSAPAWNPSLFLPEAGNAVFRSDWSPDAVYLIMLGENGKARLHGGAHDQPDGMSFILSAYGRMLAIDSGYIKWKERHKVNRPENHNLILVDGKGPSAPKWLLGWHGGTDAFLRDFFTTDFIDYGSVTTRYQGADFVRHVLFPDHRYFVMIDDIRSRGTHSYTWLLHGNGLSDEGTFALTETGGEWKKGDVSLHVFVFASEEVSFSEKESVHSFQYDEERRHSLLAADAEAQNMHYLSILYPYQEHEHAPVTRHMKGGGWYGAVIERDQKKEIVLVSEGTDTVNCADQVALPGSMCTDAGVCLVGLEDRSVSSVTSIGAMRFSYEDFSYVCDKRVNIALRRNPRAVEGHVRGEGAYRLEMASVDCPRSVSFQGRAVDFTCSEGIILLSLQGEGDLHIEWDERRR